MEYILFNKRYPYKHLLKKYFACNRFSHIYEPELYERMIEMIHYLLENYNCNKFFIKSIKDDTNIVVIVFEHIVIRIYTKELYDSISEIYNIDTSHIERLIHIEYLNATGIENISDNQRTIYAFTITEVLIPCLKCHSIGMISINPELKKYGIEIDSEILYMEISTALEHLHHRNILHRDCQLDNIGIRKNFDGTHTYVLFDFGLSKKYEVKLSYSTILNEKTKLAKSIQRYL